MVDKMRSGYRFGAVAPAQGITVRKPGPRLKRRNPQHQKAPGAQRSAQRGERGNIEPAARVKNGMPELASQQATDGF